MKWSRTRSCNGVNIVCTAICNGVKLTGHLGDMSGSQQAIAATTKKSGFMWERQASRLSCNVTATMISNTVILASLERKIYTWSSMKRRSKNPYSRCLLVKDFPIQTHNDQPIDFWPVCPISRGESSKVIKLNCNQYSLILACHRLLFTLN